MKRLFSLLVFTAFLATTAWASNNVDTSEDPEPKKKEGQYTFSLSKAYFSFFNLFTLEAVEADSTKADQFLIPREEQIEQKFLPL
jgi:hypothetical protein